MRHAPVQFAATGKLDMSRTYLAERGSAIDALDSEVRDEVRRRGVDPLVDVEAVRRFALSAVRAHDQRSLSGVVRPVDDPERVVDELVARVAGFGPLQRYLDDPRVLPGLWGQQLPGPVRPPVAMASCAQGGPSS
jgi:hypothetical protein